MREPFRLFFPLAVLLGIAGISPWILYWLGGLPTWPGAFHATVMTQAFVVSAAIGFLGTMIPRKRKTRPMTLVEALVAALGLTAVPLAQWLGSAAGAQLAYGFVISATGVFLLRRRGAGASDPPASFVFLPVAVVLGLVGALTVAVPGAPPWAAVLGHKLAQQGPLLGLVLAIAPMLATIIVAPSGRPPAAGRGFHAAAALAFAGSFPLEMVAQRAGLSVRALACALPLWIACPPWASRTRSGVHRALYRVAVTMIPVGLACAALVPARSTAMLHISFVAGVYLVIVAVSSHVVMLHTGRVEMASRRPWPVALAGGLALAAAAARVLADPLWWVYFDLLALASALWLLSAVAWGVFVLALLARRPSGGS